MGLKEGATVLLPSTPHHIGRFVMTSIILPNQGRLPHQNRLDHVEKLPLVHAALELGVPINKGRELVGGREFSNVVNVVGGNSVFFE